MLINTAGDKYGVTTIVCSAHQVLLSVAGQRCPVRQLLRPNRDDVDSAAHAAVNAWPRLSMRAVVV